MRSVPSEPTAMWKRPVLGDVQSVRKTVVPAVPALAVPLNQVWLRAIKQGSMQPVLLHTIAFTSDRHS